MSTNVHLRQYVAECLRQHLKTDTPRNDLTCITSVQPNCASKQSHEQKNILFQRIIGHLT